MEGGLLVRHRLRGDGSGRVEGYAVALPGHTDAAGEVVWYGGCRLAADLSLLKLRTRWAGADQGAAGRPGRSGRPPRGAADRPDRAEDSAAEWRVSGPVG
jgi:hypothetical protein